MIYNVTGLVIGETNVGEHDRMITIFTSECGIVGAMAKGSKKTHSALLHGTKLFAYSEFVIAERADKHYVREAMPKEILYDICCDLETSGVSYYIAEVLSAAATASPDPELFRLALNCLYALREHKADPFLIKAAFEMRCSAILGFMPEVSACSVCERQEGEMMLDISEGVVTCPACRKRLSSAEREETFAFTRITPLSESARRAVLYTLYAPQERLLSFSLADEDMRLFKDAAELYIQHHLERSFNALEFLKQARNV